MANASIDIIGIVVEVGPVGVLNTKSGERREKRSVTIADDSCYSIQTTLWGDAATNVELKQG
jgi:ssDNA-binding replication factor A large subunit